jgi:hypothetical protein
METPGVGLVPERVPKNKATHFKLLSFVRLSFGSRPKREARDKIIQSLTCYTMKQMGVFTHFLNKVCFIFAT